MFSLSFLIRFIAAANLLAQIPIIDSLALYPNEERATGSLDDFIAFEGPVALQGVLNNIGSAGSLVAGAASGLVVASPSKTDPDCQCFLRIVACLDCIFEFCV